jgi:zinc/manganese transport system permease protein
VTPYDLLVDPFAANPFMRRALAACLALSFAAAPVGVLLTLRRLALFGDALAHGILPGVALGFALAGGFSVVAMSLGGLVAGLVIALAAGFFARKTVLREDAALAGSYLTALALGIAIVSMGGGYGQDLMDLLFGSVLAVADSALLFIAGSASITLLALAVLWRGVVLETLDPGFLQAAGARPALWQAAFLGLVVLNLVAACQAVGTLMAVGLMMLPALAARFWSANLPGIVRAAVAVALLASVLGLLASFHLDVPSGPSIVLAASLLWAGSMLAGPEGSLAVRLLRRPHLAG